MLADLGATVSKVLKPQNHRPQLTPPFNLSLNNSGQEISTAGSNEVPRQTGPATGASAGMHVYTKQS